MYVGEHYNVNEREQRRLEEEPFAATFTRARWRWQDGAPGERARFLLRAL